MYLSFDFNQSLFFELQVMRSSALPLCEFCVKCQKLRFKSATLLLGAVRVVSSVTNRVAKCDFLNTLFPRNDVFSLAISNVAICTTFSI